MLIRTKLNRPRTPPRVVQRPRLLERLDTALQSPLTIISAGPGFGKTTAAVQWLEQRPVRASWLSLDRYDNERQRFWLHFVAALREVLPGGLEHADALLRASTPPPWQHFIEVLTSELAEPPGPSVVVLEDYHTVGSEEVDDLLQRVIEALPEWLHLLVLTRVDPPWPLGHWRAAGRVDELRSRDLRFSTQEARAFFDLHPSLRLDDEAVEILQRETEGWIAGLRLAEISVSAAEHPDEAARKLSASDRNIVDYLVEVVLAEQPLQVRTFLAVAARFERFCAALCDEVLADADRAHDSERMIALLESRNMFLVSLDAERTWYRFHQLFRDFILERLNELASPELNARVDSRAAVWFAEHDLVEEALRHWIAAGDLDSAAALVGRHVDSLLGRDPSRRVLTRWLRMFPAGAERGRLPLLVAHAFMASHHNDLKRMAELLDQADPLSAGGGGAFRSSLAGLRAFLLYWQGRGEDALDSARLAHSEDPPIGGITRAIATIYVAGGLRSLGRCAEALRLLDEEIARTVRHGHSPGMLVVLQGMVQLYVQEYDDVRRRALQVLAAHEHQPVIEYWLGNAFYLLGVEAYERNRLQEAKEWFERIQAFRYLMASHMYRDTLVGLALVARAEGDRAGVEAHAAAARAWGLETGDTGSLRVADSLALHLSLPAVATTWFEADPPPANDHHWFHLEVPTMTWAERLASDPRPEVYRAALGFIDAALERTRRHHNERQATVFEVLRAIALDSEGRRDAALASLSSTLRHAQSHGLVRTFLDRGPRLKALLDALSEAGGHDGYREMLRGGFLEEGRSARNAGEAGHEPWNVLSYRELEVLELLAERLTDKEIAKRLSVTPGAIKKRAQSIYRKLAAAGRRDAVARALARGILKQGP